MELYTYIRRILIPTLASRLARTERAASLVEYALLVALIAVVCVLAISALGATASKKFSEVNSALGR